MVDPANGIVALFKGNLRFIYSSQCVVYFFLPSRRYQVFTPTVLVKLFLRQYFFLHFYFPGQSYTYMRKHGISIWLYNSSGESENKVQSQVALLRLFGSRHDLS